MGQVFYRKYRSQTLDEVIGQDHITETLRRALDKGHVAHAYLFTGPRGVGKTSVARILAHSVNGLAYGDPKAALDIIEIDAASNRRIDEIRDLREKVHIAPVGARYKVYIIDEVHMLTREAFNALLKTLEEPPEHVIFILATTEAHKVPETIISRAQQFAFHPLDANLMRRRLKEIADTEKLNATEEALSLIAEHAGGSFRDALSHLDQLRGSTETIDAGAVESVLGLPPQQLLGELLDAFLAGSLGPAFAVLDKLSARGVASQTIARRLSKLARDRLLADQSLMPSLLPLIEKLLDVEFSVDPKLELETAIAASLPSVESPTEPAAVETVIEETPAPAPEQVIDISPELAKPAAPSKAETLNWVKLLEAAKTVSESLYALLRMAEPEHDAATSRLTLRFRFAFHAKRMQTPGLLSHFKDLVEAQLEAMPEIVVIEDTKLAASADNEPPLEKVADILGGEVVDL